MKFRDRHPWPTSTSEAIALQKALAAEVDTSPALTGWKTVAAADVSFDRFSPVLHAGVVVMDAQTFSVIESVAVTEPARFPYVPGLLSFREAPAVLEAFRSLETLPDVVICDGQGVAHPRRMGIASHLGLWLGRPTVGCAKALLCGTYDDPGPAPGDRSTLTVDGEPRGVVLRTRRGVKPIYVSPGHLCDIESAVAVVTRALGRFRLPEAIRRAHALVNDHRRATLSKDKDELSERTS